MRGLILVVHGSKKEKSNNEFRELVDEIKVLKAGEYAFISEAFLEFEMPSLENSIQNMIEKECKDITIYPYFLNSGKHVTIDIPEIISHFENGNKDIKFSLLSHFGESKKIPLIISEAL